MIAFAVRAIITVRRLAASASGSGRLRSLTCWASATPGAYPSWRSATMPDCHNQPSPGRPLAIGNGGPNARPSGQGRIATTAGGVAHLSEREPVS
jgi:hypothetical protein